MLIHLWHPWRPAFTRCWWLSLWLNRHANRCCKFHWWTPDSGHNDCWQDAGDPGGRVGDNWEADISASSACVVKWCNTGSCVECSGLGAGASWNMSWSCFYKHRFKQIKRIRHKRRFWLIGMLIFSQTTPKPQHNLNFDQKTHGT